MNGYVCVLLKTFGVNSYSLKINNMAQIFVIEEQGEKFEFELDENGIIWFFETGLNNPKVNIGQIQGISNVSLSRAKESARTSCCQRTRAAKIGG